MRHLTSAFLILMFLTAPAMAEHQWISQKDDKSGGHQTAKVPPSHKIPLSIPYVEGCGYNADGSIFVSARSDMRNIDREGKEISTTKFEAAQTWSSGNFKTFLGKTQEGEFKFSKDGKEVPLPKTAFPGVGDIPGAQISPQGDVVIASLEKKDPESVPWDDRKNYFGVFDASGKQIRALSLPRRSDLGVFSPDGKKILGSLSNPPRLFLADVQSGEVTYLTALDSLLHADVKKDRLRGPYGNDLWRQASFSADGKTLAVSSNRLLVFDLQKQALKHEERSVYLGYERAPADLNFTADGKTLMFAVRDFNTDIRRLELRRFGTPPQKVTLDIHSPRNGYACTAFDPESAKLLVIEGQEVSRKTTYWAREFQLADLFGG